MPNDGDGGNGDANKKDTGGDAGDEKKFTQADVERIIGQKTAKHKSDMEELGKTVETLKGELESLKNPEPKKGEGKDGDGEDKPLTRDELNTLLDERIGKTVETVLSKVDAKNARQRLLDTEGKDLLPTYKELVKGETVEELRNSLEKAVQRQKDEVGERSTGTDGGSDFGGGNGGAKPTGKKFKLSEIQDPDFYAENREEIDKARKAGLIVNDLK